MDLVSPVTEPTSKSSRETLIASEEKGARELSASTVALVTTEVTPRAPVDLKIRRAIVGTSSVISPVTRKAKRASPGGEFVLSIMVAHTASSIETSSRALSS